MHKKVITIGIDASRAFVSDPAGPEYYSWHIIHELSKIKSSQLEKDFGAKICFVLYTRPGQKPNFPLPRNFSHKIINMRYLWTQAGLAVEATRGNLDALFIPAHTLPLLTKILLPHLKITVTVHGLEGKYLPQSGNIFAHFIRNWSISWAVRYSDQLIAVSQDTESDVIKTYQISTNKITVVHEGVDRKQYNPKLKSRFQSKYKSKSKAKQDTENNKLNSVIGTSSINIGREKYVLFVGTLQPRKNLIRLIKAFSLLKNKKIKLVIAGKFGWLFEGILKAPRRYNVQERVIFTGRVEQDTLKALYRGAEAFILPSITEGFGLPILEAQASGVPVISSYGGALKEVAGDSALFINPKKVSDITNSLDQVLQSKRLREELVKKGYKNVQQYSWEKSAYNTLKIILGSVKK